MSRRDRDEFFWQGVSDLSKLSGELSSARPRLATKKSWEPLVDLTEETERLVLKAELAGVKGDSVDLLYIPEQHAILLRGMRHEDVESEQERVGVFQLEILYGEFEREVALPPDVSVDINDIRAIFRNGMLIVLIPKKPSAPQQVVIETE
ncbi:MAG: Hsp20/alpha crystallin family protein [Armatimonadetes bacterium]|nr:Hsp20 family protein [Armatimonadota bacterium]MBS1701642.1 Hsp20/alpha crystallin family protein [Armatimonadota bacterium]MBS1727293.1 Hsp20/alpha crystallin family protein [Armatimonadota bacterium]